MNKREIEQTLLRANFIARRWLNMKGPYKVEKRSANRRHLLLVASGYAPGLWPLSFERLKRFVPPYMDVCLMSAGVFRPELARIAAENGWSYLWNRENQLGPVQNFAIREHASAEWIFKLDEDIFVCEGFFEGLLAGWERVEKEGRYSIGFVAPLLNLNGYSYIPFLERMGLVEQYRERFGELRSATTGTPATEDPEAAKFIWDATFPLDRTAARIREKGFEYSAVPHLFSIGAILLKRQFWEEFGGFARAAIDGPRAIEEKNLCVHCFKRSRVIICIHNVFAGHFAFTHQRAAMLKNLPEMRSLLR